MCVPGYPFRPLQRIWFPLRSPSLLGIPAMSSHVNLDPPASILRFFHLASFAQRLQSIPAFMSLLGRMSTGSLQVQYWVTPRVGLDRILPTGPQLSVTLTLASQIA